LMKKIRVALNKSGRALTTTAVGLDGPEDASSKAVRELRSDDEFNQETIPDKGNLVSPDYSLSGKIIQNNARAGRIKQSEFAFQLSLTDLKTGLAIWEEEKLIVKQGARAAVGW
ncbi:MAG TPA: penicillin-binding protein activator LpoB, partial [Verrucomicrobiales bacterium]|nr:penicillin-binding protein activator LpoB [Verrucomicrobiales bacterium]